MKNRIILEKTKFSVPTKIVQGVVVEAIGTTDLRVVEAYLQREDLDTIDGLNTNAIDNTNTEGTISLDRIDITQDNVAIDKDYFDSSDVNSDGVITDATISGLDTDTASETADNSNNSESGGSGGITGGSKGNGIFGAGL